LLAARGAEPPRLSAGRHSLVDVTFRPIQAIRERRRLVVGGRPIVIEERAHDSAAAVDFFLARRTLGLNADPAFGFNAEPDLGFDADRTIGSGLNGIRVGVLRHRVTVDLTGRIRLRPGLPRISLLRSSLLRTGLSPTGQWFDELDRALDPAQQFHMDPRRSLGSIGHYR